MSVMRETKPVVVLGGGLAGLTAAVRLGQAGRRAVVLERASVLGGRARTQEEAGFRFNLGAHALYRRGAAFRTLQELGVPLAGGVPSGSGALALDGGRLHALPSGPVSMLATSLLPPAGKRALLSLFVRLARLDAARAHGESLAAWLTREVREPHARRVAALFFRVSCYTAETEALDAGWALAQLQRAVAGNVLYLDAGWGALVDALADKARSLGAVVRAGVGEAHVRPDGCVALPNGELLEASAVVLALTPQAAARAAPHVPALGGWARTCLPVPAASLELGLARLPLPRRRVAFGVDTPDYFSVHSDAAPGLAPATGGAMVHVLRYGRAGETTPPPLEALEAVMDRVQPGWRAEVRARRFLPKLAVMHGLPAPGVRRPGPTVPDAPGLYVAGDWVGDEGLLSDAAVSSAEAAVRALLSAERAAAAPEVRAWA